MLTMTHLDNIGMARVKQHVVTLLDHGKRLIGDGEPSVEVLKGEGGKNFGTSLKGDGDKKVSTSLKGDGGKNFGASLVGDGGKEVSASLKGDGGGGSSIEGRERSGTCWLKASTRLSCPDQNGPDN
jgi:hypothetical protein